MDRRAGGGCGGGGVPVERGSGVVLGEIALERREGFLLGIGGGAGLRRTCCCCCCCWGGGVGLEGKDVIWSGKGLRLGRERVDAVDEGRLRSLRASRDPSKEGFWVV